MNDNGLSWRSLLSLTLIAAICGSVLVATNQFTAPKIDAQRTAQANALMRSLLSPAQRQEVDWTEELDDRIITACSDWWLIHVTESGYAGPIELLAYWQTFDNGDASLLKLRVLQHLETPGIGDFIDHRRNNYLPARQFIRCRVAEYGHCQRCHDYPQRVAPSGNDCCSALNRRGASAPL